MIVCFYRNNDIYIKHNKVSQKSQIMVFIFGYQDTEDI